MFSRVSMRPLAMISASAMRMAQVLMLIGCFLWMNGQSWTLSRSVVQLARRSLNARAVTELLAAHPRIPAIVDPVMIPSRRAGEKKEGARLDGRGSLEALRRLCGVALLITPNLDEAGVLLGQSVESTEDALVAA